MRPSWAQWIMDLAGGCLLSLLGWLAGPAGVPGLIAAGLALPILLVLLVRWARRLRAIIVPSPSAAPLPLRGRWLGHALAGLILAVVAPFIGALLGSVAYFLFTLGVYHWLDPVAAADGQFSMIFFVVCPLGAGLGIVAAETWTLLLLGHRREAGVAAMAGAVLLVLLELAATGAFGGDGLGSVIELSRLPEIGAPLPWTLVLFLWGLFLLRQGAKCRPGCSKETGSTAGRAGRR